MKTLQNCSKEGYTNENVQKIVTTTITLLFFVIFFCYNFLFPSLGRDPTLQMNLGLEQNTAYSSLWPDLPLSPTFV